MNPFCHIPLRSCLQLFVILAALASQAVAAIPPAEKLLPADTLLVFSVPDCEKLGGILERTPQNRLWNDPAMKPFRDACLVKWKSDLIEPLERDLGVKLADYTALLRGQLTLAITQDGWTGQSEAETGNLLLLDARDKSDQLKTNLTELRKKWTDAGKAVRTEKLRDVEFSVVTLSSNDVPPTIKRFFPQKQVVQELGREPEEPSTKPNELVVGQFESLLIVASSLRTVESVVAHLTGGSAPALADEAAFESDRLKFFRESAAFGWCNAKRYFDVVAQIPPTEPNPQAPTPLVLPDFRRVCDSLGLLGLKTLAFNFREQPDGALLELFIGAPDATRKGLFSLLTLEGKESGPPAFVPADAVKFQRCRLDGKKFVATLEKMLGDISPQYLSTWNFLIQTGEAGVRQSNPDYDLRKSVFGNLGDDLIAYEKAPRGSSPAELAAPPSLLAIGSPDAEALCRALAGVLVIRTGDALSPKTREFLGRKIYSVRLPGPGEGQTLSYTAGNGYVAFSTDALMVEEFIRSVESPARPLKETAGLAEAAERVGGLGTGLFCYENQVDSARLRFELSRKAPETAGAKTGSDNPYLNALPFAGPEKSFRELMDFTLLPEFAKVSKYFHFGVWAANSNVEGINFKFFSPTPPGARPAP